MPSMMRRMRTRLPTYLSTGLGALVDISSTPWDCALRARQSELEYAPGANTVKSCSQASVRNADNLSNELNGSSARRARQNANCMAGLSTGGFPLVEIFPTAESGMDMPASGTPLRNAPPNHENQGGGDDDRGGDVAAPCINSPPAPPRHAGNQPRLHPPARSGRPPPPP